jgi:hypothetical protein
MSTASKGRPRISMARRRFGRLRVVRLVGRRAHVLIWLCRCDCGDTALADGGNLRAGRIKSCGCLKWRHGLTHTKEYKAWDSAKQPCNNPRNPRYHYYGGRGIRCQFNTFPEWLAALGPAPTLRHQVDRINGDGHYAPGNVRWATLSEQARNRKSRGRLGNNQFKRNNFTR